MVQHMDVPALKQMWVLDAQWTDCPVEVEEEIKLIWRWRELGNDNYMLRTTINDIVEWNDPEGEYNVNDWDNVASRWVDKPIRTPALLAYLRAAGIPADENFIIHWWW